MTLEIGKDYGTCADPNAVVPDPDADPDRRRRLAIDQVNTRDEARGLDALRTPVAAGADKFDPTNRYRVA